ncbi:MAG: ATP-binding protein [Oscillospiraceae bacterium]|nr:ATP-binding protein [Oscillospiraceae bacterium]
MKKYILLISIAILILLSLSLYWFSVNQTNTIRSHLRTTLNAIVASEPQITDYTEFVDRITDVRITIIDRHGVVLADNRADIMVMDNRSDRPEFIAVQTAEYGEDIRISATTGTRTIYVMTAFNDEVYIRLAESVVLAPNFLLWLLMPILLLALIFAIFLVVFAKNKQTEDMRSEFVANVSHELKTPLTSVKGFAELIQTGLVTDKATIKEYQSKIVRQSDRLLAMIDDILHLSKLEHTKAKKLVDVDTKAIACQVNENLKIFADEKSITLQVVGNGKIRAEFDSIYEMLYNLVDNGIKYGKRGGYVQTILDGNKITVKDNGIGIPQSDCGRIFERFYRVDKSRSVERGGTGLGLSIVKHTAKKYRGKVSINSVLGDGTEISISF